jgi:D-amino-acid oxidase
MEILVIGGGVIGLTTALVLQEHGHTVTVVAKAWAPDIVSSVAAAIWHPYQVAHPDATHWGAVTAERLTALYDVPEAGVRHVIGCAYHRRDTPVPEWAGSLRFYDVIPPEELPAVDGIVAGYCFEVPLIETPLYMQWLRDQAEAKGIDLQTQSIASIESISAAYEVIVNCTGLGAAELVGDTSLYPIRGQIVKVEAGRVDRFLFDDENPYQTTYIIPRADGTIVGGTAIANDYDMAVRDEVTEAILTHATTLHPALKDAPVLEVLVGLRPGRPQVRLEKQLVEGRPVIHNYGHGGAGYTLSWGCAEDVAKLVNQG